MRYSTLASQFFLKYPGKRIRGPSPEEFARFEQLTAVEAGAGFALVK